MYYRLAKEQISSGRSQETLDSVGLQTPSETGTSVHEEETAEGNYAFNLYYYKVSSRQVSTLCAFTISVAIDMLQNSSLTSQQKKDKQPLTFRL